ncbi:MAG: adenylate/guanylate cyclase domain-containing protein [Paracoccaceae bacterium]|nr:adenylate/guanylate cyclase domain-containing protein [Paracoccaceae bacterium]MDG1371443.1 adenylate/guanylate cyclase domain-containing protein [Paracoccaceae bacterium]
MSDIPEWLASVGLSQYANAFEENEIYIDLLGELDQDLLKEIGVKTLGHRLKILKSAKEVGAADAPANVEAAPKSGGEERRQLTIQFCDLVGSTEISSRMDPEDYRELMRVYQETASNVILKYGGYVAQYLGDGLMTFFGYPLAQEDAAERAVRSGLEIVAEVKKKSPFIGEEMKVRIGIATGTVVVGDIVGQRVLQTSAASGETTNLAARLQGVAGENMVVISGDTKRLLRSSFSMVSLGEKTLKGISQPITAWHVIEEEVQTAAKGSSGPRFVGRQSELETMLSAWNAAKAGNGRVTLLEGEPGIGKSRLVQEYREKTEADEHFSLTFQCSSFFTETAFHPLRRHLEHEAKMVLGDSVETRLDKLIETLARVSGEKVAQETGGLFASVLSLPLDRFPAMQLSAGLQKQKTIEAMIAQITTLSDQRPIQIFFEDAHWVDQSSLEAVSLFVEKFTELRVHMIITHRPEFAAPWSDSDAVKTLNLKRLSDVDVLEIISGTTGLETLPEDMQRQLAARTDGIPLFAQELAKSFSEGRTAGTDDQLATVPATLQDSLMARLDRLGSAREAAQLASVIGREFETPLLQRVSGWPEETVRLTLSQLEAADLIFQENTASNDVWMFRHALIQDAAYESIMRRKRRGLHEVIAEAIVKEGPDRAARDPEYVARHFSEANRATEAATHWLNAGRIAWGRAAAREALASFDRGLEQALKITDEDVRNGLELQLQSLIGVVHFAATSYASPQAQEAFERARQLCDVVENPDLQMTVLYGLGTYQTMKGDIHAGHQTFVHLSNVADDLGVPRYDVMSASLLTWSYYNRGHYRSAVEYGGRVREFYAEGAWTNTGARTNAADPLVVSDAFLAASQWVLGDPSLARKTAGEVLEYAKSANDPYSLAYAYTNSSIRAIDMIEDWETLFERAESGIELSDKLGYVYLKTYCTFWRARALSELGNIEEAAKLSDECMNIIDKLSIGYHRATYVAKHAKMLALSGQRGRAQYLVEKAPALVLSSGEYSQESEVMVLTGDYHLICGQTEQALHAYRAATRIAISREELSWELRSALKVAKILVDSKEKSQADDLLRPIFDRYPGKDGKGDPQTARALLDTI